MSEIGYIYKISSNQTPLVYFGSTTTRPCLRKAIHRYQYKAFLNNKNNYLSAFEVVKYPDHKFEVVETVKFDDKNDLRARERHYIDSHNCCNSNIPGRTPKEYCKTQNVKDSYKLYRYHYYRKKKISKYESLLKQSITANDELMKTYSLLF